MPTAKPAGFTRWTIDLPDAVADWIRRNVGGSGRAWCALSVAARVRDMQEAEIAAASAARDSVARGAVEAAARARGSRRATKAELSAAVAAVSAGSTPPAPRTPPDLHWVDGPGTVPGPDLRLSWRLDKLLAALERDDPDSMRTGAIDSERRADVVRHVARAGGHHKRVWLSAYAGLLTTIHAARLYGYRDAGVSDVQVYVDPEAGSKPGATVALVRRRLRSASRAV